MMTTLLQQVQVSRKNITHKNPNSLRISIILLHNFYIVIYIVKKMLKNNSLQTVLDDNTLPDLPSTPPREVPKNPRKRLYIKDISSSSSSESPSSPVITESVTTVPE